MQINPNAIPNRLLIRYRGLVGSVPAPEKWVFIVGCYNSGTTLLHKILANHSSIGSMSIEGQVCTDQFVTPKQLGIPRLWAVQSDKFHLTEEQKPFSVARKVKRQWGHVFNHPERPILLEKSITNTARIRWLNHHFANAHFISFVRNGYAVSEGIHRKTGHDIKLAAKQWAISNEIMLEDLEMVPDKISITYEEFTRNPATVLNDIADFLNIENTFIQGDINGKDWLIHGVSSQISNMNNASFDRLNDSDKKAIEKAAAPMLKKFGYTSNND